MFAKTTKYYYDHVSVQEEGTTSPSGKRELRSVWHINTAPYRGAHCAAFPPALAETCIKCSCPEGGLVLDPFLGSGTTMRVAMEEGRDSMGIELNGSYVAYAKKRLNWGMGLNVEYRG